MTTKIAASCVTLLTAIAAYGQTICIDPGHPSEVGRGASGKKISEVKAVWQVGNRLQKLLKQRGYTVVMTKSKVDQFVKNKDRSQIANKAKADLMIRLHCDAQSGSGFAVYAPMKQGKSGTKVGPSNEVIKESIRIGKLIHAELKLSIGKKLNDNGFLSDEKTLVGSKQGALTGSIYSEVPVILLELVRLTDAGDDAFIASSKGQEEYAKALANAIEKAIPVKSK